MVEIKAVCSNCKKVMTVNAEVVKRESFMVVLNGEPRAISVIHYDCPICLERHFVQIDDAETDKMLHDLTFQIGMLAALKKRNAKVSKKREKAVNKLREDLAASRKNLMIEFDGVTCNNDDGSSFTLRFSV